MELARRGHEIHFVSYAQPFRLTHIEEGVYFHEVEVNRYPLFEYPPYSLALAVTMHEVTRKRGLDLFHVHYAIPHATTGWIAKEMAAAEGIAVKLITTLHGTDITLVGQDPSYWSITRFSIERSDGLTAVSEWLRHKTHERFVYPEREIQVIPNFVDPAVYDRDRYKCHRSWLAPDGEKIVMHISNFRPVKRIPDLIRTFARIAERIDARLVLIGDGPDRQTASELAVELGIEDRLMFLGKLESVAELLSCADLFLLPSEQESFGLVALEALASGAPVVGTSGSGLDEVIDTGVNGYLHPVGDTESMADSSIELLTDDQRWRDASEAAKRLARERFNVDRVVAMYEAYYEEVLAAASAGTAATG